MINSTTSASIDDESLSRCNFSIKVADKTLSIIYQSVSIGADIVGSDVIDDSMGLDKPNVKSI